MNREEEKYLFWLCSIHGLGLSAIRKFHDIFSTAEAIYYAPEEQINALSGKIGMCKGITSKVIMSKK